MTRLVNSDTGIEVEVGDESSAQVLRGLGYEDVKKAPAKKAAAKKSDES